VAGVRVCHRGGACENHGQRICQLHLKLSTAWK
jgi:hypothetical protein